MPTLSTFVDIEDIPKKYGGKLDFEFGKFPNLDPKMSKHMTIETKGNAETFLVASPVRWVNEGKDGEMTAVSVGVLDGKQREERVAVLHSLATRVATNSSNLQSQGTETTTLPVRSATSNSQAAPQGPPVSNGAIIPPAPATELSKAPLDDPSKPSSGPLQQPIANGGPPESKPQNLSMPPPPTDMDRTKTDFFTPPSDPSEAKQLQ